MPDYADLLAAAAHLPLDQRLRLIDDLTDTLPEVKEGALSPEWVEEIERRSAEIDAGAVETVPWEIVRKGLFKRVGLEGGA